MGHAMTAGKQDWITRIEHRADLDREVAHVNRSLDSLNTWSRWGIGLLVGLMVGMFGLGAKAVMDMHEEFASMRERSATMEKSVKDDVATLADKMTAVQKTVDCLNEKKR